MHVVRAAALVTRNWTRSILGMDMAGPGDGDKWSLVKIKQFIESVAGLGFLIFAKNAILLW